MADQIWSEDWLYSFLRHYVDSMTRSVFRKVRVIGKENIPTTGAVILTPNHCNTLMDALNVLQIDHRPSAYGARADIFRKPKTAAILRWLRMVPMARTRDGLDSVKNNFVVFDEVAECIVHDVPFCIFPEGAHFAGYEVHTVKSGVFHIAENAKQLKPEEKVSIIPVGLSYSNLYKPQSSLTIRIGEPIDSDTLVPLPQKERSEILRGKIQELVCKPEEKEMNPILWWILAVLCLPVILPAMVLSSPMWIASGILLAKAKDKLWGNTIRFGVRTALTPILTILYAIPAFICLKWYLAIALIVFFWVSPTIAWRVIRRIKK